MRLKSRFVYSWDLGVLILVAIAALALGGCAGESFPDIITAASSNRPASPGPAIVADRFTAKTHEANFLLVIDNSGSMSQVVETVNANVRFFMETAMRTSASTRMHFAVTTTDVENYNGRLVSSSSGATVVTSYGALDPVTEISSMLGKIKFEVDNDLAGDEAGLENMRRALKKYGGGFLIPRAELIVVMVSDEKDQSPTFAFDSRPEDYAAYLKGLKVPVRLYPIVGVPNDRCAEVRSYDDRYDTTQRLVGSGLTQSICKHRMAESFRNVAKIVAERGVCYALARPTGGIMQVRLADKEVASSTYSFDSENNSVCFGAGHVPAEGVVIEVHYVPRS